MRFAGLQFPSIGHLISRISVHMKHASARSGIPAWKLTAKYIRDAISYSCRPFEYNFYRFYEKNAYAKKQFMLIIPEEKYEKRHSDQEKLKILDDKQKTFCYYHDLIGRDWCGATVHCDIEDYRRFLEKRSYGIMKPIESRGGYGIEIICLENMTAEELMELCRERNAIVEELIIQHEDMASLNPDSVNTVRLLTLKTEVVGAAIRMGTGNSRVDNAHSGGIFAEVDVEDGVVISKAINHLGDSFVRHPTTGSVITGFRIPMWDACMQLAKDAAERISEVPLIGWDVAVTPNGPVLIEGNTTPGLELIQSPNQRGIAALFKDR